MISNDSVVNQEQQVQQPQTPDGQVAAQQPQPQPQSPSQPQQQAPSQPQQPTASQPQSSDKSAAQPNQPAPAADNSNHPLVKHASILHDIAQTLAGGPRYKTSIDVNTGETKRTRIPLDRKDIGMALAMSAIQGGLAGLGARGPNAAAQAAGMGFNATAQARQQADQQQQEQANADYARKEAIARTNMQMMQNASSMSHATHDMHQLDVDSYAPVYEALQKVGAVKDIVSESDLPKYNVTKDGAVPVRVVARQNSDGTQAIGKYGEPLWDKQYAIIDPTTKIDLPDDVKNLLVQYKVPGFVNSDGKPVNLPSNLQLRAQMVIDGIEKANTIRFAQHAFDSYSSGKPLGGGSTGGSIWTLFTDGEGKPDLNKLADAITAHEGGKPGDRNMRNNNPGNLKDGPFAKSLAGYDGQDEDGFAKFKSADAGQSALVAMLRRDMGKYPDASPVQYINAAYSPDSDKGNDPGQAQSYADFLLKQSGKDEHEATSPISKVDISSAIQSGSLSVKDLQVMQKAGGLQAFTDGKYGEPSTVDKMVADGKLPGDSISRIKSLIGGDDAINEFKDQRDRHIDQVKEDNKLDYESKKKQQEEQGIVQRNDKLIDAMLNGDKFDITKIATMRAYDREIIVNEALRRADERGIKWNPEDVQARINLYNDAADSSKTGSFANSVKVANTSLGHMGGAVEALDRLKSKYPELAQDTRWLEKPLSWFNDKFGTDPDWIKFKVDLDTASTDWQNLLNNQHALTDHDKETANQIASPTQPMKNSIAAIQEMAHTAAVRIVPLNDQWKRTMGSDFPDLVNSGTVAALKRINNPEVNNLLGDMQSGGNLRGSSDGAGTPGKSVKELMGNNPAWAPPSGLRDPQTVKEGTVAKDAQGNPVAVVKGGKWQNPQTQAQ
jgi:hypothetical protein